MNEKRTIVIGRHLPDFGKDVSGFDIVGTRNINFPSTSVECLTALEGVLKEAGGEADVVLLQAVPGQLAVALRHIQIPKNLRLGIVISRPGPRLQGEAKEFVFTDPYQSGMAADAVTLVNPNAKIEYPNGNTLSITVDPPMKFQFSHIEWFD